jgi:hypothetical protein
LLIGSDALYLRKIFLKSLNGFFWLIKNINKFTGQSDISERSVSQEAKILEDHFSDISDENRAVLIVGFFSFHDDGKKLEPSFQVEIVINFQNSVGERDFEEIKPTNLLKIVMRRFEKRDEDMFEHFLSFLVKSTVK